MDHWPQKATYKKASTCFPYWRCALEKKLQIQGIMERRTPKFINFDTKML